MDEYAKPLPRDEGLHGEFYGFSTTHELRFQRCAACNSWRHIPRERCAACGSFEWSWQPSTGKATLYSWTTVYRAVHPAFTEDVPYTVGVVEMDEGVRLVSRLHGISTDELKIGLPLEVVFEDVTPDFSLHKFQKSGDSST